MKEEIKTLIKYRLQRANETLSDAEKYMEEVSLNSVVNRIYYAMFYVVSALLISKGLSSSKHSGVRALFNKEFVNEGLVDKESGRFYFEMFKRRQTGDYRDFIEFKKEDVEKWLGEFDKSLSERDLLKKFEEAQKSLLE